MEEEQGFEIDPEMAAQMGFASFGMQPSAKKRKFTHNDAVVDTSSAVKKQSGSGANSTELGIRSRAEGAAVQLGIDTATSTQAAEASTNPEFDRYGRRDQTEVDNTHRDPRSSAFTWAQLIGKRAGDLNRADLEALSKGVRTVDGDVAHFKPTFINDPWASLKSDTNDDVETDFR